jgi:hypothetical protein
MSINRKLIVGAEYFRRISLMFTVPFDTVVATRTEAAPVKEADGNVAPAQEPLVVEENKHQSEPSSATTPSAGASSAPKKRRSILGKIIHQLKQ